ncbi:hypothetical protein [Brevibacillus porteri]|uniref:hypothetical protein n=1 Tax=Brevibacillus porteri TaxID=2126350 RepID=UPI003D1F2F96
MQYKRTFLFRANNLVKVLQRAINQQLHMIIYLGNDDQILKRNMRQVSRNND